MRHIRHSLKSLILFLIGIILVLPLCATIFSISAINSNLIPVKYIVIVDIIAGVATIISLVLCLKLSDIGKILSSGVCLLLSVLLCVGTYFIFEANDTLHDITNTGEYYDQVAIVTLVDSDLNKPADLNNVNIGIQTQTQSDLVLAGLDKVERSYNIQLTTTEYENLSLVVDALMNGEVDAIMYNSSYGDILDEQIDGYQSKIKVILYCNLTFDDIDAFRASNNTNTNQEPTPIEPTVPEVIEPTTPKNDDVFAVYLSGIDVYGSISIKSRSDVNIIAIVKPSERKVLLVTTPRDYFVQIPGVSGEKKDKLTHAGIYGVQASMDTLSQLYDVDIDYYFRVNFTSFEKIINALGGVDVYSQYSFNARGYSFSKGYNHVNGEQALVFARERYSFQAGDNQRGKNQQELIKAIIKKACSPAILTAAGEILNSVRSNIDTNIPEEMIQDVIRNQLEDNREWQIDTLAATGTGSNDSPYSMPGYTAYVMIPNQESVSEIKEAIQAMYE